jgi:uncharacterized protein (DUF2141 family)
VTTILAIILVIVFLGGGGGHYGRRRYGVTLLLLLVLLLGMSVVGASASGRDVAAASTPRTGTLKVTINGVRSGSGTIMIGLYDSNDGFLAAIKHSTEVGLLNDKGRVVGAALRAAAGSQSIVFTQLNPGRYAVIVFHDENDNGRLDENAWGVPTEGYGFSNNAEGFLTSPSFDAAGVALHGADNGIGISLIYPKLRPTGLPESP